MLIEGKDLEKMSAKELELYRRDRLGFVFQSYNFTPDLTARENIEMTAELVGAPLSVDDLVQELGLTKYEKHFPKELSGGQQQRVAIARAMVKKPDILLCDELTGALDSKSSRDVLKRVQKMNETYGTTILIITHNVNTANMADRIIKIKDGKVVTNIKNNNKQNVEEMELENDYDVIMEYSRYKDIMIDTGDLEGSTIRVFDMPEKLNLCNVRDGRMPESGEVLLTQNFADAHDIKVGDTVNVGEYSYKVSAFATKADYIYMLEKLSGYVEKDKFAVMVACHDDYDKIDADETAYYSIRYNRDNSKEVRAKLNDDYVIASYLAATTNTRISMPVNEGDAVTNMATMYAPIMFIIVLALIVMVLGRNIRNEQYLLGTFLALGFSKKQIVRHYMRFGMLPGIVGSVLGHPGRSIVTTIGVCVAAFCIMAGLIMDDSLDSLMHDGLTSSVKYNYLYRLNSLGEGTPDEGEALFQNYYEVDGNTVQLSTQGIDEGSKYFPDKTDAGDKLDLDKYYLTSAAAETYGVKTGDELTFCNIADLKEYKVKISGVVPDNTHCYLYTSRENATELAGVESGVYNCIISDTKLKLDKDLVASETSMAVSADTMENIMGPMNAIIVGIEVLGIVLGVFVLYLVINMIVSEMGTNISVMKVLGFSRREITNRVLNVNHIIVCIGSLIGIPAAYVFVKVGYADTIENYGMLLAPVVKVKAVIIGFVLTWITYEISLLLQKRKISRIDMVESLKENNRME